MKFKQASVFQCLTASILLTSTSGCSLIAESQTVTAQTFYSGSQCVVDKNNLNGLLIKDVDSLNQLETQLNRNKVGYSLQWSSQVDFQTETLIFISMGAQPSGGYGLSLPNPKADVNKDTATLQIQTHTPKPGMMTTQAITYPCLLAKLELDPQQELNTVILKENDETLLSIQANAATNTQPIQKLPK